MREASAVVHTQGRTVDTVLFDLDGTLLPIDQDLFVKSYFAELAKKVAPLGYDPGSLVAAVVAGTRAMAENDGSMTNAERFWDVFTGLLGPGIRKHEPVFEDFYRNEFNKVGVLASPTPKAAYCVRTLKQKGYDLVLATNPLFPMVGTLARMGWAGVDPSDFSLITTYEDCRYCKPNRGYFEDIAARMGKAHGQCLMVGNDADEDLVAQDLGMDVFLLTDCLINKSGRDVSSYRKGGFNELLMFIDGLPVLAR